MENNERPVNLGQYAAEWKNHDPAVPVRITDDYIVHIDKDCRLDWETTKDYDKRRESKEGYRRETENAILNEITLVEVTPREGLPENVQRDFLRLLGEALVCCIEDDYSGAKTAILAARRYLKARSEEKSRDWYLAASFMATAPFVLCGVLLWLFRNGFRDLLGSDVFWLSLSAVAGATGALFSVIVRSGKLAFDASAGRRLHNIEGTSRIVAGAISGVLVALAVKADILFSVLTRDHRTYLIMVLAALVAGAGERLASSIISKFDAAHVDSSANEKESRNDYRRQATDL